MIVLRFNPSLRHRSSSEQDANVLGPDHTFSSLETLGTFHSYVKPTWRPQLSSFCKNLVGVGQASEGRSRHSLSRISQLTPPLFFLPDHSSIPPFSRRFEPNQPTIDSSPTWPEVSNSIRNFLLGLNLLEEAPGSTSAPSSSTKSSLLVLKPGVTWVTHGTCDLQDFVVKQSFISSSTSTSSKFPKIPPPWLQVPLLDVRKSVFSLILNRVGRASSALTEEKEKERRGLEALSSDFDRNLDLNLNSSSSPPDFSSPSSEFSSFPLKKQFSTHNGTISGLLKLLDLDEFEGKQHSGLDDSKNIERIFKEVFLRIEKDGIKFHEVMEREKEIFKSRYGSVEPTQNDEELSKDEGTQQSTIEKQSQQEVQFEIEKQKFLELKEKKLWRSKVERDSLEPFFGLEFEGGIIKLRIKKWNWMGTDGHIRWYRKQEE